MDYDVLLTEADSLSLTVKEKPLQAHDGRIRGDRIAIREDIETNVQKACVLAEELGHHQTTAGDIMDQSIAANRKQELRARAWAYNHMVGLMGLISAFEHGCQSRYEAADYLDVTEEFLEEAVTYYRNKYGTAVQIDTYVVFFEPFGVMKMIGFPV